ncbi:hypothetical protein [Kitasatospora sp. NPDC001175]|uniref:hypothetical protein n=1 Tax=Kitasatospora sp. NPDC001175 TaxID=3157103 RepID=UPI003CFD62ED
MTTRTCRLAATLLGAASLAALTWTAQAATAPAAARLARTCAQTVQQTRLDLANAGVPTRDTAWQDVRDDAQEFVNDHPWGGAGTQKLSQDVSELNAFCAP